MAGEKSTTYASSLLQLVFNGTTMTGIAMNTSTAPLTNLYFSLHTADPLAGGNQTTSEIAYTSYARVAVARTSGGFTVTGNSVSPAAIVIFPTGTGGTGTATNWAVGTAASGTGQVLYTGPLTPSIVCGSGVTPEILTSSTISEV